MDLPDKSGAQKPRKKKVEQVVSGAKRVERPASRRFFDFLFAESPKALGAKVARDVVVPRVKMGFEEAANSFLAGMLWGDSSVRPMSGVARSHTLRNGGTNYNVISGGNQAAISQARQANVRSSGNYQDLVLASQQEAELLLANMYALINEYSVVAVADLYEAAGITPDISDDSFGWRSLDGARISYNRDGYLLELPRPTMI